MCVAAGASAWMEGNKAMTRQMDIQVHVGAVATFVAAALAAAAPANAPLTATQPAAAPATAPTHPQSEGPGSWFWPMQLDLPQSVKPVDPRAVKRLETQCQGPVEMSATSPQ
jgi:hypothetical protein